MEEEERASFFTVERGPTGEERNTDIINIFSREGARCTPSWPMAFEWVNSFSLVR